MSDSFFYDRDGGPVTGKPPLQLVFVGEGDRAAAMALADGYIKSFLADVRLSLAAQLQKTQVLPDGSELRLNHSYGVTQARLHLNPKSTDLAERFFGGILIRPTILTNETSFLNTGYEGGEPTYALLTAAKSSGKTPTNAGRPEVPGTRGLETDWLVVQVHPTKSLEENPLQTGAVKIYRIRQPKAGGHIEMNSTPGHYVVSTLDGSEFFVCGKKMTHVPAMPITMRKLQVRDPLTQRLMARIRTLDLVVPSFADAALTEGVIVVAYTDSSNVTKLYGINTRNRSASVPAAWVLLAEVTTAFIPNLFATSFEEVNAPGVRTVRCQGSNKVGVCSGFEVTLTSSPTLPPELAGSLTMVDSGFVAGASPTITYEHVSVYRTNTTDQVETVSFIYPQTSLADPYTFTYADYDYVGPVRYDRYVAYRAYGFSEDHTVEYHREGGTNPVVPNLFLGGFYSITPLRDAHYSGVGSSSATLLGFHYRLKGWQEYLTVDTAERGVYDLQGSTWPVSPTTRGATPTDSALYFGGAEAVDFYGFDAVHTFGEVYQYTYEFSAVFDPWAGGISSTGTFVRLPLVSTPGYFQYDFGAPGDPDPDPDFRKYPYLPPVPDPAEFPPNTSSRRYDSQNIAAYPKMAAVFDCDEFWAAEITVDPTGNELGISDMTATITRIGQTRADEYLAEMWPTCVDSFPAIDPAVVNVGEVGNVDAPASGEYPATPSYAFSAHDTLENKLAWRVMFTRGGAWSYEPSEIDNARISWGPRYGTMLREYGPVTATLSLLNADGAVIFEWVDFMTLFSRHDAAAYSISSEGDYAGNANPFGQLPVYYVDPDHPEYDAPVFTPPLRGPGANRMYFPQLVTAYWNRSITGDGLDPLYPTPRINPSPTDDRTSTNPAEFFLSLFPGNANGFGGTSNYGSPYNVRRDSINSIGDIMCRDPRTGGFLTQVTWASFSDTFGLFSAVIETMIGNASGVVPFVPILKEWIALGTDPGQSFTKILLASKIANQADANFEVETSLL